MSNEKEYKTIVLCGVISNLGRFVPKNDCQDLYTTNSYPETELHPLGQLSLAKNLCDKKLNCNLVVLTHSPCIVETFARFGSNVEFWFVDESKRVKKENALPLIFESFSQTFEILENKTLNI